MDIYPFQLGNIIYGQFTRLLQPRFEKVGLYWICPVLPSFCHSVTFQSKFFITLFSRTVRPRRLKLCTHVDNGQMYRVYWNQAAALIHPFISSFFFLSNFQKLKFFITLFSGTMGPRRLKLGTHMDSRQIYRVYRNQAAAAYLSLYFFIFLSLQFSNIKNIHHTFLRNCEAQKVEIWCTRGQWVLYPVYRNQAAALICPIYFFIFLSLQFSNIKIFCHTFLRSSEAQKIETWYTRGQWADVWCIPESGCCCLFVPLLCPPPKGRETYCFWCGSCRRDTFLFARYLMNRWVTFN